MIESASYSIRWGHRLAGMDSPAIDPLVKGVVEGARRKLARPVQPKQPLKHDSIAEITLSLNSASASLADIRFLFILVVGYAGVFRIREVLVRGPVGGPGSRSLLWFLPRFPAPILVRFFLASECLLRRIRARLALYCMRWGIQPPGSVVFAYF